MFIYNCSLFFLLHEIYCILRYTFAFHSRPLYIKVLQLKWSSEYVIKKKNVDNPRPRATNSHDAFASTFSSLMFTQHYHPLSHLMWILSTHLKRHRPTFTLKRHLWILARRANRSHALVVLGFVYFSFLLLVNNVIAWSAKFSTVLFLRVNGSTYICTVIRNIRLKTINIYIFFLIILIELIQLRFLIFLRVIII